MVWLAFCHTLHCGGNAVQSTRASGQLGGTEKALKHEYDDITEKWEVTTIFVRLDPTVIAEVFFHPLVHRNDFNFFKGTNRLVYNITDLSAPKGKQSKVAKAAKSSAESVFDLLRSNELFIYLSASRNVQGSGDAKTVSKACRKIQFTWSS